ncbi:protein CHLOROPLAST IMPORT APPARATUS 2-like [Triticum dicoccoides]|uniref:protein CHLOROPLAST IMPORT APPARATUS 2-like n=1 Tax=Triticum dicoccoides TaxID=85692 RepID=UPI001891A8B9|nr:protein CHLOROPLAST IMPORT APPARATUS 2-like [Triticum dicoccoides]
MACIPTGIRLPDLDMVKAAAAAAGAGVGPPGAGPLRPAHSSASSALSDASNSSSASSLSLKRARTPRKRPNQTYNEAAALLASMYPSVFPAAPPSPRLLGLASALADDPSRADLLPPFPVLGNAAAPPPMTPRSPVLARACPSPAAVSSAFTELRDSAPSPGTPDGAGADGPGELDFEDDDDSFDADSFLLGGVDEGAAAQGIEGIMGKLSMESGSDASSINRVLSSSGIDPYIRNLMVLGLGFRRSRSNIKQALKRHDDDSEWWMCPAIPLKDIMPVPPPSMEPPPPVEKKKKKTKKKALKDIASGPCITCVKEEIPDPAYGDDGIFGLKAPKTGLGLSLNTEEVLKAWYDRGSVFSDGNIPDASSTDGLAKLSDIELFLENGAAGAIREGSVQKLKHKQKQCTPLLSNKTRYQARKVHAESRPRVKGRFVSQAALLQKAAEKET